MSGLLALLDDVAAIAKLAAAQLDDVAVYTAKAGSKAAGVVIDDAAVTPKYVVGLPAARELPIVWKIARASFFNKLVILAPAVLLLDAFFPWILVPLLMIGGAYLCFEGAEKVAHLFAPHAHSPVEQAETLDAAHLEERRVKGAIKTDFILSAEITVIALAAIETDSFLTRALTLATVAIALTTLVYGAVAVLVKMDDLGLRLARDGGLSLTRSFGRGLVKAMPVVMKLVSAVGTAAMLWVGGNILVHGLHDLGVHPPYEMVRTAADAVAAGAGAAAGATRWLVTAAIDGAIGLAVGLMLMPIVNRAIVPLLSGLFPEKAAEKSVA
jgi:hypothetical protein